MKIVPVLLLMTSLESGCQDVSYVAPGSRRFAVLTFSDTVHDFGTIREGQQVSWRFRFRNTGTGDLLLVSAASTCGCTIPDFTGQPVSPGDTGSIRVLFDSRYKTGRQVKPVFIQGNTRPPLSRLTITCNVLASTEN